MANIIVTQPSIINDGFDPRLGQNNFIEQDLCQQFEEACDTDLQDLETEDIVFFALRCLTCFICLSGMGLVLVSIGRGNKLKSWRLYFLVALSVFSWLALTLYQDYIDFYFVGEVTNFPQSRSIYWCFRNFLHGFSLYMILLLMAHLSDMQHRSYWFGFIAGVFFVPLIYSVGLLITDLKLDPETRKMWYVNIAIASVRVFFYNILSTFLLFFMSRSFCTSRLYGTYSEKRSKVVVVVARWTYAWLLIHNLVSMASYAIIVITLLPDTQNLGVFTLAHRGLEEAVMFTIVLCVPASYLIGILASCCCGVQGGNAMEMDKVDKIYTDVWTTPSLRPTSNSLSTATTATASASEQPRPPVTGLQNGVVARRNRHGSDSTLSSIDSIGELPRIGTNPAGSNADRRKRVRESYMEAVSMGSLNDDRSSITSDPVDL